MRTNILNYEGYLKDTDRTKEFVHTGEHFTFRTNLELSVAVRVTAHWPGKCSLDQYSNDLMWFSARFAREVLPFLNGFQGFGRIKFVTEGFELIDTSKEDTDD